MTDRGDEDFRRTGGTIFRVIQFSDRGESRRADLLHTIVEAFMILPALWHGQCI